MMLATLVLAVVVGPPAPPGYMVPKAEPSGFSRHARVAAIYGAPVALDLGMTEVLCASGCRELILGQTTTKRLLVGAGEVAFLTWLDQGPLRQHHNWQRGFRISTAVVRGALFGFVLHEQLNRK